MSNAANTALHLESFRCVGANVENDTRIGPHRFVRFVDVVPATAKIQVRQKTASDTGTPMPVSFINPTVLLRNPDKEPLTTLELTSDTDGAVVRFYIALDDEYRVDPAPSEDPPLPTQNVTVPQVTFNGATNIPVPQGVSVLRLGVQTLGAGITLAGLDNSNTAFGGVRRLLFVRPNGAAFQTLNALSTASGEQTFIIDVSGMTAIQLISSGGNATAGGSFSAAKTMTEVRSITLIENDLAINPGVDTIGTLGTWTTTGVLRYPGIRSAKLMMTIAAANTLNVGLDVNPVDDQGNVLSTNNVQQSITTGVLAGAPGGFKGIISWYLNESSNSAITNGQYGWGTPLSAGQAVGSIDWPGFTVTGGRSVGTASVISAASLVLKMN